MRCLPCLGLILVLVSPTIARASDDLLSIEAASLKWEVRRSGGSGFVDALWFDLDGNGKFSDAEQVVAPAKDGRSRLVVNLAVPPQDALPAGNRSQWKLLPGQPQVTAIERHTGEGSGAWISGKLTYPDGIAEGSFKVVLRASPKFKGVLFCDLELGWEKLPERARLVEAALELETVFALNNITARLDSPVGASWGRGIVSGFPVSPASGGSSLPYPTGGFRQRHSLWLQEDATFGRSIHYASVDSKSFQAIAGSAKLEWCDFGDSRQGLAVVMKGMAEAAPKMFGTVAHAPNSLFAWAWPPMTDGLEVQRGTTYSLANLAFVAHAGSPADEAAATSLGSALNVLPPLSGNLRWPVQSVAVQSLPQPDLNWLAPPEERSGLPSADPEPQANRIPILLASSAADTPAGSGPAPIRTGVPFPAGALKSLETLRLIGPDAKELPCQVEQTAVWPDGSVKWLLLDFVAVPPPRGATHQLAGHLEWGPGVGRRATPPQGVSVAKATDGSVTVDTGVLRFTASRGPGGFLHTADLDLNGDGRYAAEERIVNPPAAGERRAHFVYVHQQNLSDYLSQSLDVPGLTEPAETLIESVTVEAAGPLRATLRLDGRHRHPSMQPVPTGAKDGSQFTVWLTAYAGQSQLRVTHDFVVEGTGGHQQIAAIGLSLPLNLDAQQRKVLLEGNDPARPIVVDLRAGEELANVQERQDRARVVVYGEATENRQGRVVATGHRASDWLSVADSRWGVAVGMKDMWELNPQAICVGSQDVKLWFWPPQVAPWDTRGAGQQNRGANSTHERFRGVSRTHEAVLHFFPSGQAPAAPAAQAAALREQTRQFTEPVFARASTAWTCATGALGLCHAYDPERFPAAEALQRQRVYGALREMMLRPRVTGSQPGIATYGSAGSTESYTQYGLATLAARTGWPELYRAALAKCRFDAGMAYRRGVRLGNAPNHPSDWANSAYRTVGDSGSRGSQIMYYLTGDESLRATSDERARALMESASFASWASDAAQRGASRMFNHYGRTHWGNLLWAWERGGKADYAAGMKRILAEGARGGVSTGRIDCGTSNAIAEVFIHCGEPAIVELAKQISTGSAGKEVTLDGQQGTTVMPALVFWQTGDKQQLGSLRASLNKPVLGGAFDHYTMYATMRMQATMAALTRHGLSQKDLGGR